MRVLHVIHSVSTKSGGPIAGLIRIAESCDQLGYHVEVACLNDPAEVETEKLPFPVYAFGPGRGTYGYSPRLLPWLEKNLDNYDGVVVNGIWQYNGLAVWKAAKGKKPYFVFTHGMLDPWFKHRYPLKHIKKLAYWTVFENKILNDANAVLFTTPSEMKLARQNFPFHRWTGVVVPYGALGPDSTVPESLDAFYSRWPALRGKRLLLYLGRIHEKKGCDLLIEAFAQVARAHPDLDLVMAGPDAEGLGLKLQARAQRLGIENRVHWTGMLEGNAKWGAVEASDAFILPSHQENFGIAVAEAMACRLPVLITNKVNTFEEVEANHAGLVENDDLAGVTKLLDRYLRLTPIELKRMGTRAIAVFQERYDIQNCGQKLLELFASAIETAPAASRQFATPPAVQS